MIHINGIILNRYLDDLGFEPAQERHINDIIDYLSTKGVVLYFIATAHYEIDFDDPRQEMLFRVKYSTELEKISKKRPLLQLKPVVMKYR